MPVSSQGNTAGALAHYHSNMVGYMQHPVPYYTT